MVTSVLPTSLNKKTHDAIIQFTRVCSQYSKDSWNLRSKFESIDRAYQREENLGKENQRAKTVNAYGDFSRIQDLEVPVVMPAVEAAVTYQSSVFLTGEPLFGIVASPENVDAGIQLQTKISHDAARGGWVAEFMKLFRNGFKYNIGAVEVDWKSVKTNAITSTNLNTNQGAVTQETWSGNTIKNLDVYNTFYDPRVNPVDIPLKGEYAGYVEYMSRIMIKQYIADLDYKIIANVVPALESSPENLYYTPVINPANRVDKTKSGFSWMSWAGLAPTANEKMINYSDSYEVITLYARILPIDFGLRVPNSATPQIWKFVIVNSKFIIYAEQQTNAHNMLPIFFIQPNDDGLGYQTKSLADNVKPVQHITSAMWGSIIAARRKAIYDRVIYDPSRIPEHLMNSSNPIARIPVRPSAFGKSVGDAIYTFPFRDTESPILMQETSQLANMSNLITGQNPVRQGQFVKGNKTQHEFQTVMGNANGRDQVQAMLIEAQIMTPIKTVLRLNVLQYQGAETLFDKNTNQSVSIDPQILRKAVLDFKVSDGLVPSDKLMNADTWMTALQVIGSSPQINSEYNMAPMFSYLMKQQGADLKAFEKSPEQKAYEQALQVWQETVAPALQKGVDPNTLPPQPKPADYGYNPQQVGAGGSLQQPQVTSHINNIVNNVSPAIQPVQ